jgi:alpha-D-ribose 1-methylphosphonate 5-triphosphate diphosphatase
VTGLLPAAERAVGWRLGDAPASYVVSNVRVALADRITEPAAIVVEDGRIVEVVERGSLRGDVDGASMLLAPGLIDVHSDALEKERAPRPSAQLPWDFALASYESKLVAAGITTMFHGAGFHNKVTNGVTRDPETTLTMCGVVDEAPRTRVDHRVLHRFNVRADEGARVLRSRIEALPEGELILLSHEDHTPGQGQYADVEHFIESLVAGGEDRAEARTRVRERMAEAEQTLHIRDANLAWAGELARSGRVRLFGHDADSPEAIDELVQRGGAVAEFPTTIEAARRAREHGLLIVAGGPNVLRGGSHSGNVSASELVAEGLVDAIASDYLPTSLLGGVATLVRDAHVGLARALRLVTAGAAAAAGLSDRGSIEPGLRADLVLIDDRGRWPRAVTTFSAGAAAARVGGLGT